MKRTILVLLICLTAPLFAVEYGYEPFDYAAGSLIGNNGGSGWSGSWNLEYTQGTQEVVPDGLTFSDLPTAGGALKLTEDNVAGSFRSVGVRRGLAFDPPIASDVWISFLAKSDGALTSLVSRTAELRHGPTAGTTEFRMRPKGGGSQGVMIAYDSTSSNSSAKSTQDGRTYLYVCRFGDVGTVSGKYAVMWVFDEAAYEQSMSDGMFTEDDLNNNSYLIAQDTHANKMLDSNDSILINIGDSSSDDNFSYFYDEIRYGDSLQDVVPNALLASSPSPSWGASNVTPDIELKWTSGAGVVANGHRVYFGTDRDAVELADATDTTGIYKGSFDANSLPVSDLELGARYFWRVDEVTSSNVNKGYVWDFWTLANRLVDDFEIYADSTALKTSWEDYVVNNSGATIQLSTAEYKTGSRSMEYLYESQYGDSIATANFDEPQDWTLGGALLVLDICFKGQADNSTSETMFVTVEDAAGSSATINYSDSANLAIAEWQVWHIEVDSFAGVDLSSISKLTIGFKAAAASGSGYVYFDDIVVYPCRAGSLKADLNEDCIVNIEDIAVVAEEWMQVKLY